MSSVVLESPAKLNLFLAITGRRADGFHDLVSVVSPLTWGDTLHVETASTLALECDVPEVPLDETNLILKAARAFAGAVGGFTGARFKLTKRIPIGAGLGGGSSNAATALLALNQLAGKPLSVAKLAELAVGLGSDCPLFLHREPVIMRGRGERIETLAAGPRERISGRRVLVFKPSFGISTPWAYSQLAAGAPATYLPAGQAEEMLSRWCHDPSARAEQLLFNTMEAPAFRKFVALPTMVTALREHFRLQPRMSGSGSACFALLPENASAEEVADITALIRSGWGPNAFVVETKLT